MSIIAEKVPRRGVIIVISDLLTDLDAFYGSLGKLQYFGHEVILHVLHRDEIEMPFRTQSSFATLKGMKNCLLSRGRFAQRIRQR
ncbi:MAG: hypothetical protein R3B91_09465 [Planctomycetaceae bacterium]